MRSTIGSRKSSKRRECNAMATLQGSPEWHPVACIFPMMDDASLHELADDIKKHGQYEPIMLYEGKILDGRNRSAACWSLVLSHNRSR